MGIVGWGRISFYEISWDWAECPAQSLPVHMMASRIIILAKAGEHCHEPGSVLGALCGVTLLPSWQPGDEGIKSSPFWLRGNLGEGVKHTWSTACKQQAAFPCRLPDSGPASDHSLPASLGSAALRKALTEAVLLGIPLEVYAIFHTDDLTPALQRQLLGGRHHYL